MPKLKRAEIQSIVEQAITHSTWQEDAHTKGVFKDALDSYYGKNRPGTTEGLSTAVSNDVADMVEAVVAQIMPAFDFDEVAVFDALGADDYEQARLESKVCNGYLRDDNDGYVVIQQAIRNCLLLKNGILKVEVDRSIWTTTETFKDLNPLELQDVTKPTGPEQTIEVLDFGDGETEGHADVQVKTTYNLRELSVRPTDTLELVMTKDWKSHSLRDIPLVGEHLYLTRSELQDMGVPRAQVKRLKSTNTDPSIISGARQQSGQTVMLHSNGDSSMEYVEAFELYLLIDADGDGIAERMRVLYAGGATGGEVVMFDPWPRVPYASGTPFLQSNRWEGLSLYDKLCEIENQKTEATRQLLDNLGYANNAEMIGNPDLVNFEDLKERRPGGLNRADDINAVRELVFNSNVAESIAFLNYADKVRSERGGASLDLQAAQLQIAGDTAHGVERQFTSKEQLSQLMTRTIAETLIRQTVRLIHDTLRTEFPDKQFVEMGNQFVAVTPGQWRPRKKLNIIAGMSAGERRERKAALEGVLVQQEKLMAAGKGNGQLVSMATYHAALNDWTAAGGVQNPGRYWIDPRSPGSQQAQKLAAQQAQAAQQHQQAIEQRLVTAQLEIEENKRKAKLVQDAGELQFKYWDKSLAAALTQEANNTAQPGEVDNLQETGEAKANV